MRFTVTKKIVVGLATISILGIVAMLVIYAGLDSVERTVHKLAIEEQPFNAAAYEMEVNVNGIGFAVLKYLATRDARYRVWVDEDHGDFAKYHATYLRLTKTPRERELGAKVAVLFKHFSALGYGLMHTRDQQQMQFGKVLSNIERIDRLIDDQVQPAIVRQQASQARQFAKALAVTNLEAEIAELGFSIANYQRIGSAESKNLIFAKLQESAAGLVELKSLELGIEEGRLVAIIDSLFEETAQAIKEVVTLEDFIFKSRQEFIDTRGTMDELFDYEIQPLAMQALALPREQADQAALRVLLTMQYLIPTFLLTAALVGFLLVRSIMRPLNGLTTGTEAISRGNLAHRLPLGTDDEFGDLALRFNRMVEELEATTVSRELLMESERKLQRSVASLRHQISERERAEHEREKLEADLRRSEMLATMGALTAGVAHEVRNPLFGISSTLDAMEARFSALTESQPYLVVLRREVDRMSKLMGDLLEYGKPIALELRPCPIEEPIALAVTACMPVAEGAGVAIEHHDQGYAMAVACIDRNRIVQVFQNLLENAIHFSPRGGIVTIATGTFHDDEVMPCIACTIADRGPGFEAEDLPHVFEPFFTRRRSGTGLGLSIVRRIVEAHGGVIVAGNGAEGGATLTVRLPGALAKASADEERRADGTQ